VTDLLPWLDNSDLRPGEFLLLLLFLIFLASTLHWPFIWDWVQKMWRSRKGE